MNNKVILEFLPEERNFVEAIYMVNDPEINKAYAQYSQHVKKLLEHIEKTDMLNQAWFTQMMRTFDDDALQELLHTN